MTKVVEFLSTPNQISNWIVPAGVTNLRVDILGAGANGNNGTNSSTSKGGSGGGFAYLQSFPVNPGDVLEYYVSGVVAFNAARTITYFGNTQMVAAYSGINTNGGGTNAGGAYLAGDGGFGGGYSVAGRLGGGGAAGPNGPGGNVLVGGGGGGGANGGGDSQGYTGGNNRFGYGGGAAAVSPTSAAGVGVDGGGGGGGNGTASAVYFRGADGSQDTIWISTITGETAGPGGGGGSSSGSGVGGNGGGYGAGGGGSRAFEAGRQQGTQGLIVLTYEIELGFHSYSYWL